jgi:hypothetical protein
VRCHPDNEPRERNRDPTPGAGSTAKGMTVMNRARKRILAGACLLAGAVLAGCDDGSTGVDDDELLLAMAEQAAADAHNDVQHMRAPGIPGLRFPGMRLELGNAPDCPQENGVYVCTNRRPGLTTTFEITFKATDGSVQDEYSETETASVEIVSTTQGTLEHGRFGGSVDRTRELTVSGLAGNETTRIWNGRSEGVSTREFSRAGETETVAHTSLSVIEDLVIPHPREDDSWPLSGTITTELDVQGGPRAGEHTAVVTFDGTQFATVVIDGETMTVDLTERRGFHGRHGKGMGMGTP